MGRFLSPDPSAGYYSEVADPQSLNLYIYGRNNPLINIDPSGLDCIKDNGNGTYSHNDGDCANETEDAANHEYYVDCDGCTSGGISDVNIPDHPGGVNFSTANGSFYADQGGSLFNLNATGYGLGLTDETITALADIHDMVTGTDPFAGWPLPTVPTVPWYNDTSLPAYKFVMDHGVTIGCLAGLDPGNVAPSGKTEVGDTHERDEEDKNETINGQHEVPGPNTDVKKGGTIAYNTRGTGNNAATGVGAGAEYVDNVSHCFGNASQK